MRSKPVIAILTLLIFAILMLKCRQPERVEAAYREKEVILTRLFATTDASLGNKTFFRVFKNEKKLEVWVENKAKSGYVLVKTYPICAISGVLGRKLREGDRQVPEGCYDITIYNPKSSFWLSLGLNYPNEADKKVADANNPGSDIFIHGNCVSIGCMAMTDDAIKEIYLVALEAKKAGNDVPIHIFPFKMEPDSLAKNIEKMPQNAEFWQNLQPIYQYFEEKRSIPAIKTTENGGYSF